MGSPLSILVVSFNAPALLERCLASLVDQAAAHHAELIVVRAAPPLASMPQRFELCQWVQAPEGETIPRMRSLAIAAARGDVVALIEDDCVADAGWCAAVLAAHQGPWVAVGGAVEPGPYARGADWAVYFYEYGRFMLPFEPHPAADLPGNNVSYKREALLQHGAIGADGFHEVFVHDAWRGAGRPMRLSPTVIVQNRNSWPLAHLVTAPFHHGRVFAARRARQQSVLRRLTYALGMPLLPALQIFRVGRQAARARRLTQAARSLPWIALFGASWAIGEWCGALLGEGPSARHWR